MIKRLNYVRLIVAFFLLTAPPPLNAFDPSDRNDNGLLALRTDQPATFLAVDAVTSTSHMEGSIQYRVTVNDPQNELGANEIGILANLDAAVADWARFIKSNGVVWIELKVVDDTKSGQFGGGSTSAK